MTNLERLVKFKLESLGFDVIAHQGANCSYRLETFYTEFPFGNFRLDFALPFRKLAIEVQGEYWHGTKKKKISSKQLMRQINDAEKADQLVKAGWKLLIISEYDLMSGNVDRTLREFLSKNLKL